nr:hypothetical protein Iba_chr02cCG13260 [Ipomoea batatas]
MHGEINSSSASPSHSRQILQQGSEPLSKSSTFISFGVSDADEDDGDESTCWAWSKGSVSLGLDPPNASSCTSPFIDPILYQKQTKFVPDPKSPNLLGEYISQWIEENVEEDDDVNGEA